MIIDHHHGKLRPNLMVVKTIFFVSLGVVFIALRGICKNATNSLSFSAASSREDVGRLKSVVTGEGNNEKDAGEETLLFEKLNERVFVDDILKSGVVNNSLIEDDVDGSVLMVVAHPDDEVLWGGEYLIKKGKKVHVVITCTKNKDTTTRFNEFRAVQRHLGYHGEFLDGKDSLNTKELESHIQQHIQNLVCQKKWERIVTHGPEGEYGHPQHQIVHDAVLEAARSCCHSSEKLFVFEPHPSKKHDFSESKKAVAKLYKSQEKVIFGTFANWKEQIVALEKYDYKKASKICRDHQNPKKKVHPCRQCRLHKVLNFSSSNYDKSISLGPFSGQGHGC